MDVIDEAKAIIIGLIRDRGFPTGYLVSEADGRSGAYVKDEDNVFLLEYAREDDKIRSLQDLNIVGLSLLFDCGICSGDKDWQHLVDAFEKEKKNVGEYKKASKKDSKIDSIEPSKKDAWYKKYGLFDTLISLDLHLDENDLKDATTIVDGVKHISIKNYNAEFGFEGDTENDDIVVINAGFFGLTVKRTAFEKAVKRFHLRSTVGMDELAAEVQTRNKGGESMKYTVLKNHIGHESALSQCDQKD